VIVTFLVTVAGGSRLGFVADQPPDFRVERTAIYRFRQFDVARIDVIDDRFSEGHVEWSELMARSSELFQHLRPQIQDAGFWLGQSEDAWWSVWSADTLSIRNWPDPADHSPYGRFSVGWDGAAIAGAPQKCLDEYLELGAQTLAQWTAVRFGIEGAREVLRAALDPSGDSTPDAHAEALEEARSHLIIAMVEMDPRVSLHSEYQVAFVTNMRRSWHLVEQIPFAERAMAAVQALIDTQAHKLAMQSQDAQRRLTDAAAFWLFVVSIASGISVVFAAVDFVASSVPPSVGNYGRVLVLLLSAAVTGVLGWRYRSARLPN